LISPVVIAPPIVIEPVVIFPPIVCAASAVTASSLLDAKVCPDATVIPPFAVNVPLIVVLNPDAPIDTALLPDVPIETNPVFVDAKVKVPPPVILIFPFVEPKVIFPVVAVRPNAVPLIVVVDNVPLIVVVIPEAPIVNAVAVDVPTDKGPADAVVRDGDVKAEAFITPVEEIEPVLEPFLNNVPIIFPDDAVIFPLVSVIPVVKVGFESGAYVVDASADVK
jgi:hypothetical protein